MNIFDKKKYKKNKVVFAVGTGRCGTRFLQQLLYNEKAVASHHERAPLNDTFHRYFKWYGIPLDSAGFLHHKAGAVIDDFNAADISFEASSYLSFSIMELYNYFDASFIFLVRDPVKTSESYFRKGYYSEPYLRDNPDLPPSYQPGGHFHHFLGRVVPGGNEYVAWSQMSRIAKIGWFWNAVNTKILDQFSMLPDDKKMVIRLDDFDYAKYLTIAEWIGFKPELNENRFINISEEKPNTNKGNGLQDNMWTPKAEDEFFNVVRPMAEYFNYTCLRKKNT